MLKKILTIGLCGVFSSGLLTGCGFQLRGYSNPVSQIQHHTQLNFGNSSTDIAVKNTLKQQLNQLGIPTSENQSNRIHSPNQIKVSNIQLQTYQLRGLLTEIRLVMTADVHYEVLQQGKLQNIHNTIQVQRSYQYDQATLATDNPQAEQITLWLYDNLAERIVNQYMALITHKNTTLIDK